jgi:predicted phosphodiesterase
MVLQMIRSLLNRSSFSFQILSDLHLEVNRQYSSFEIPVCCSRLILAGDIGRLVDYDDYRDFLQRQTERFERVFLVLGNHEFYNMSFAAGLEKAKQLEKEPSLNGRLVLLHQKRYDVPNSHITILGCTLWSKVPSETRDIVNAKIKDFQKIEDWTIDDHNAAYDSDIFWLRQQVRLIHTENDQTKKRTPKRLILIATHHAPSLRKTSNPQHTQNLWSSAFATDILSEDDWNGVKIWVFGHTHYTTEFKEAHVRVVSNQRGYVLPWSSDLKKSNKKHRFDVKRVIWT